MNPSRKRLTIVLAAAGAIGAIAAIAIAASFALFYDPVSPQSVQFVAGNVTLNNAVTANCTIDHVAPGYSTDGYPSSLGDQSGQACTVDIDYTGGLDAFLALDVSVSTSSGSDTLACNGGDATGTASCAPLYNPDAAAQSVGDGLEVYVLANGDSYEGENGPTQSFGIGNDQTISQPGTENVDLGYSQSSSVNTPADCNSTTGVDCPVQGGDVFRESFSVYVYWPLDSDGTQNVYQNSSATVTLREHAVQASDNPLFSCDPIGDSQGGPGAYQDPDQPQVGWGAGFNAGLGDDFPAVGSCPTIDSTQTGVDWTASTPGSALLPFYHPDN